MFRRVRFTEQLVISGALLRLILPALTVESIALHQPALLPDRPPSP